MVRGKEAPLQLRADATYLLPGGLGGLGRSLAYRMAERGARHLVFTSRSGAKDPRAKKMLEDLSRAGVRTKTFAANIGVEAQLLDILQEVKEEGFPAVRGVVTLAMQLQDVIFDKMTVDNFWAAVLPKVNVTRNLHNHLPKDLDFFVCMSSLVGVIGNRSQGNYAAGMCSPRYHWGGDVS